MKASLLINKICNKIPFKNYSNFAIKKTMRNGTTLNKNKPAVPSPLEVKIEDHSDLEHWLRTVRVSPPLSLLGRGINKWNLDQPHKLLTRKCEPHKCCGGNLEMSDVPRASLKDSALPSKNVRCFSEWMGLSEWRGVINYGLLVDLESAV